MDRNNIINVNSVPNRIVSVDSLGRLVNDRIKLAEAMGWKHGKCHQSKKYDVWRDPKNSSHLVSDQQLPDPFTDANDERAVFRFMCGKRFSVRRKFFKELDRIVQDRLKIKEHAAWPEAMMFMQDGDIARAALKVLE